MNAVNGIKKDSAGLLYGDAKEKKVVEMFDNIAPRYELLNTILTFGLDKRWRKIGVSLLGLNPGSLVGDIACGTGDILRLLNSKGLVGIGLDPSRGMLVAGHSSSPLVQSTAEHMPLKSESLDGIVTSFALRNFTSLEEFFNEAFRTIKPGGRFMNLDVGEPKSKLVKVGHNLWFNRAVPLIGALLSDKSAYAYLPKSTSYLPAPSTVIKMLEDVGFIQVRYKRFLFGSAQLWHATRPVDLN